MKEKLIDLLYEAEGLVNNELPTIEMVADHLIANGVTMIPVRCKDCDHGSHVDTPEGRVWREKMCRYMVYEGYCSYGKKK